MIYPFVYIFKTNLCCRNLYSFVFLEMFDNTFLIKFAQHNLLPTEQFQLGALLNLPSPTIDDITRDTKDSLITTFKILEKWVEFRRRRTNSMAMFDELAAACVTIKRSDLVDFVRCGECDRHVDNV